MENRKLYESIIDAKELVGKVCQETDWLSFPENASELIWGICRMKVPAMEKFSILTVISTGTISNGGFLMPSTRECMESYRGVMKYYKKHHLVPLWYYENEKLKVMSL